MEIEKPAPSSSSSTRKRVRTTPAYRRKSRVQRKAMSSTKTHIFSRKFYHSEMITNKVNWQHFGIDFQQPLPAELPRVHRLVRQVQDQLRDCQFIYDHNAGMVTTSAGTPTWAFSTLTLSETSDDKAVLTSVDDYLGVRGLRSPQVDSP